jgi:hypothetical protein
LLQYLEIIIQTPSKKSLNPIFAMGFIDPAKFLKILLAKCYAFFFLNVLLIVSFQKSIK